MYGSRLFIYIYIIIIFQGKRPTISAARTVYFIRDSDGTTLRDGGFYMAGGEHEQEEIIRNTLCTSFIITTHISSHIFQVLLNN
jgi:hypothetical protein